jgi:uncharacterized membrane protein YedE/YeeE
MVNPAKVLGFLDILGDWDPSLALVMVGAIGVMSLATVVSRRMERPLAAEGFQVPTRKDLDRSLLTGALLFGVGWGLVGFCPGPALAALSSARIEPLVFVLAMLGGMSLHRFMAGRGSRPGSSSAIEAPESSRVG